MPFLTRSRLFNYRLLATLVALGGLASGCQSSRPSFSFQPIGLRAAAAQPAASTVAPAASVVLSPAAPATEMDTKWPVTNIPAKPQLSPATRPQRAQAPLLAAATPQTTTTTVAGQNRIFASPRRLLRHRAHAPAEVGLGLTVLGLLAMVALVVALVGLAISGGGAGWIIAAAIAAGVVLLAYLDPHGH